MELQSDVTSILMNLRLVVRVASDSEMARHLTLDSFQSSTHFVSRQLDNLSPNSRSFGASGGSGKIFYGWKRRQYQKLKGDGDTNDQEFATSARAFAAVGPPELPSAGRSVDEIVRVGQDPRGGPTFALNFTQDGRQTDVEVEVCLPIADDAQVSVETPFTVRDVAAVPRAAVMVYVGPCDGYFSAYQTFFNWIGAEKLTPAGPSREVYMKRPSGNTEEDLDSVTEIQLPIA